MDEFAKELLADLERGAIDALCDIGERAYQKSIQSVDYMNDTGNLRSSIGWGVYREGKLIAQGGFTAIAGGVQGSAIGKDLLDKVDKPRKGYALVFVAGMHYASYVESTGRDVNTSGELLIEALAEDIINQIRRFSNVL